MCSHVLDPSLPADSAPIVSGELRCQFQAIKERFDRPAEVAPLGLTVSNPPTRAEVQAMADKLDELIGALQ
jgi:hypothetical protein